MCYSTAVTFAVAKVLTILTRLLKPLTPHEKLQVLQHLLDAAGGIHADVTRQAETKGP